MKQHSNATRIGAILMVTPFVEWLGDSHPWMRYRSYPRYAHRAFPPVVFAPAAALLDEALNGNGYRSLSPRATAGPTAGPRILI